MNFFELPDKVPAKDNTMVKDPAGAPARFGELFLNRRQYQDAVLEPQRQYEESRPKEKTGFDNKRSRIYGILKKQIFHIPYMDFM
jgi:hypothetical protein